MYAITLNINNTLYFVMELTLFVTEFTLCLDLQNDSAMLYGQFLRYTTCHECACI